MNYKKVLMILLVWLINPLNAIPVKYLKGTYDPLPQELQHLSPLRGAIWWESGLVENYYRFGFYGKTPTMEYPFFTIRLIKMLFHEVQGSFNITQSYLQTGYFLSPITIGKILGIIENQRGKFKGDIPKKQRDALASILRKTISDDPDFKDNIANALKKTTDTKKIALIHNASTKELNSLVNAIIGSLQDCGFFPSKNESYYPPYTTQAILLASLYRKAEATDATGTLRNKIDLKNYFEALFKELKKELPAAIAADAWLTDVFPDFLEASEELKAALSKEGVNLEKDIVEPFGMEYLSYIQLVKKEPLPRIAQYRKVTVEGLEFPDCAETTMRNLINIIFFNQDENILDINNAPKGKDALDPEILKFYSANFKLMGIEDIKVHHEWAQLISNRPCVVYFNCIDKKSKQDARFPLGSMGFVHGLDTKDLETKSVVVKFADGSTQELQSITINGGSYIIVDPEKYFLCEVAPSMRNVILLCNQFLGLKLFENPTKAFLELTFDETYFPRLIEALKWQIEESAAHNWDKDEVENKRISVKLQMKDADFAIEVQSLAHAQLITAPKIELVYQKKLFTKIVQEIDEKKEQDIHILDLIPLYFSLYEPITIFSQRLQRFCYYLRSLKIPDDAVRVLERMYTNWHESYDHLAASLIAFLGNQADESYVARGILRDKKIIERSSELKKILRSMAEKIVSQSKKELVTNYAKFEMLKSFIALGMVSSVDIEEIVKHYKEKNDIVQLIGLYSFLVDKGMFIDEAKRFLYEVGTKGELSDEEYASLVQIIRALSQVKPSDDMVSIITAELINKKRYSAFVAFSGAVLSDSDPMSFHDKASFIEKAFMALVFALGEIPLEQFTIDVSQIPFDRLSEVDIKHMNARNLLAKILSINLPGGESKKSGAEYMAFHDKTESITLSLLPIIAQYVKTKEQADIVINFFKKIECDEKGLPIKDGPTIAKELEATLAK